MLLRRPRRSGRLKRPRVGSVRIRADLASYRFDLAPYRCELAPYRCELAPYRCDLAPRSLRSRALLSLRARALSLRSRRALSLRAGAAGRCELAPYRCDLAPYHCDRPGRLGRCPPSANDDARRRKDAACPHPHVHKAGDAGRWGTAELGSRPGNGAPLRARVPTLLLPCERGSHSHTFVIIRPRLRLAHGLAL